MKHTIKTLALAIIMMLSCTVTFAQQQNRKQRISREELAEKQAKHIAEELNLNDETTAKFVSTFCNYQKEIWALGLRQPRNRKAGTEKDSEERIKQKFERSEDILKIRQKYYKEYSKFLTQSQIEKMYKSERKMMKRLAERRKMQKRKG